MIKQQKELSISLAEHIKRFNTLSTEEQHSTTKQLAVADKIYDNLLTAYETYSETLVEVSGKGNGKEALRMANFLEEKGKELLAIGKDVLLQKKISLEMTILLGSRFDVAQVLSILTKLPELIEKAIDEVILSIVDDIHDHIEEVLTAHMGEKITQQTLLAVKNHNLLNRTRRLEVASLSNVVSKRIAERIDEMRIPETTRIKGQPGIEGTAGGGAVIDRDAVIKQLAAMERSVAGRIEANS